MRDRDQIGSAVVLFAVVLAAAFFFLVQHPHVTAALPPTPPAPTQSNGRSTKSPPTAKAEKAPFNCAKHSSGGDRSSGSVPYRICVPAIHVATSVMKLGLNSDHTVQVPPLSQVRDAGWYKYSAAPGAVGPTVILGHIDSAEYGKGVFYRLGQLRSGDLVALTRGDGKIATFVITRVREVPKTNFPTQAVYGPTSGPAIRLVTCGGQFDASTGNYLDNIIAFGTLRSIASRS